jgi:hypothetical protein
MLPDEVDEECARLDIGRHFPPVDCHRHIHTQTFR